MDALLKIPSTITTPISLAALVIIILYLVYKLLFEHKLLVAISETATAGLLRTIINWVGVLALLALLLSLSPYLISSFRASQGNGHNGTLKSERQPPGPFSKEVNAFSAGVDRLSDGFTAGYSELTADRAALVQLGLTGDRAKVSVATSCFDILSSPNRIPCSLYRFNGTPPALSGIERVRDKSMLLMKALKDYAQALVAVTDAADREAYNAAVAQLASTVSTIVKYAVPQGAAAGILAPAEAMVGKTLDQQRLESLKVGFITVSTPLGNGTPINSLATVAGAGLSALVVARQAVLVEALNTLTHPLGPSLTDAAYRQRLGAAQTVVGVLDGLRQTDPTATAAAFVKTHEALVAAVNDPSRNYPSLVEAVGDFANQAAALDTALSAKSALKSTTAN